MKSTFDPNSYWQGRVGYDATISNVGHRSFGTNYNEYIYRRRLDVLGSTLEDLKLVPEQQSVLDVGCGSGFYTHYWQQNGLSKYLGVDLSGATIERLQTLHPDYRFVQADIAEFNDSNDRGEPFSIVTIFDVTYHIVDDARLLDALRNIRRLLAQDGIVIVFEQLARKDYAIRKHVKFRGRDSYRALLNEAGLEIAESRPLFNFLVPPILGSKLIDVPIAAIYRLMGLCMIGIPPLGRLFGKLLYQLDRGLFRLGWNVPNNELLVLRHRSGTAEVGDTSNAS